MRQTRTKKDSRRDLCRKVSGQFPKYGAIFMSNKSTLKECFKKGLFGLPESFSGFVRNVKKGMTLFLFEFEKRKLYGGFKAISDGGMNIVPGAYKSSGKQFPAQVKFTRVWHCEPLYEDEFCDAIKDNYFSTYKFNFGLSKHQVRSLMRLFKSRKCEVEVPHSHHYNKRKERKWDFQSIEEPEVEKLSLSSDSCCRKRESIHFNDPEHAYDPEHPGLHHSVGHESQELHTLQQQKKGNIHVSSSAEEETEVYIPLCSADDDSDDTEKEEEIDHCSMFVGSIGVSSIPIPKFLQSDLQSKHGTNNSKSRPTPKGMYADKVEKRTSVFSRLNFSSKNQNDVTGNMVKVRQQKHGIEDCRQTTCSRRRTGTKGFMRLTGGASHAHTSQLHCITDDRTASECERIKKRKKGYS